MNEGLPEKISLIDFVVGRPSNNNLSLMLYDT